MPSDETGLQADQRRLDALQVDGRVVVPQRLAGWVYSLLAAAVADLRRRGRGDRLGDDVLGLLDDLSLASASVIGSKTPGRGTIEVEEILTCAQAAQALGCTERAVRQALQDGRLHGLKTGPRHWTIRAADLEKYRHTKGAHHGRH